MQLGDILNSALAGLGQYGNVNQGAAGLNQGAPQPPTMNSQAASVGQTAGNGIMNLASYLKKRNAMMPRNQDTGNMPPQDPGSFGGSNGGFGGFDPNSVVNA